MFRIDLSSYQHMLDYSDAQFNMAVDHYEAIAYFRSD